MFYLDFSYIFFVFFLWNKSIYEKYTANRNVSINIYFENLVVYSFISFTRGKSLTCAMTNFVQQNGLIFVKVELWEFFLLFSG